ncbi:VOC family protein [Streptomonospora litoralis]|uniref:VOC family protein n=1 Tax=Streptomonospora litoralis TaxID=2498135 RepID=UPI001036706E
MNATSVFVDDQAAALTFYTEVLGFVAKTEVKKAPSSSSTARHPSPNPPDSGHHRGCGNGSQ